MKNTKKKFFNATVGGYYVVSVILGIAMALMVGLVVMESWSDAEQGHYLSRYSIEEKYGSDYDGNLSKAGEAAWKTYHEREEWFDESWYYLPMADLYGAFFRSTYSDSGSYLYSRNYASVVMAIAGAMVVFLSVQIMEGKSANKNWKQKMLQAIGWGVLLFLVDLTYSYVDRRIQGNIPAGVVLVPVVLLVIPALILKKTKVPVESTEPKKASEDNGVVTVQ